MVRYNFKPGIPKSLQKKNENFEKFHETGTENLIMSTKKAVIKSVLYENFIIFLTENFRDKKKFDLKNGKFSTKTV